jgi:hypothetical protein
MSLSWLIGQSNNSDIQRLIVKHMRQALENRIEF